MLIAHCADLHIDARDAHAKLEEQVEWLRWIADDAAEHGARAILCAGDIFERASVPAERKAAADVFTYFAERAPVVIVRGNHDALLDLHYLGRLRTKHPVHVMEEPGVVQLDGLDVACLPWPRRAWLAARMGAVSRDTIGQAAADALRAILQGFSLQWRDGVSRVVLAHAELGSASLDSGQPVMAHCDVPLAEGDLDTGADYVALGHIHKTQTLQRCIRYCGSPRPTAFGQDDDPKGYSLVEFDERILVDVTHRVSPARRLVTVEAVWPLESSPAGHVGLLVTEDDVPLEEQPVRKGEAIRIQYTISETNRRAAREQAERAKAAYLERGAHSVKIDARITTTHRVRSEAIREARTTADRIEAWWAARDERPAAADRLLSKVSTLEEEIAA